MIEVCINYSNYFNQSMHGFFTMLTQGQKKITSVSLLNKSELRLLFRFSSEFDRLKLVPLSMQENIFWNEKHIIFRINQTIIVLASYLMIFIPDIAQKFPSSSLPSWPMPVTTYGRQFGLTTFPGGRPPRFPILQPILPIAMFRLSPWPVILSISSLEGISHPLLSEINAIISKNATKVFFMFFQ